MPFDIKENEQFFDWNSEGDEGQLAVDVFETKSELVVISTLAGAVSERIDVSVHNDLLTIRGERPFPIFSGEKVESIYHRECFWGKFSRTVVLPVDVKGDLARAEYHNGVLIIHIPKQDREKRIPVTIVEE